MVNSLNYLPKTDIETLFMIFILIANCWIFGYVINECKLFFFFYERNKKKKK
jgi:hypothetical protein